MDEHFFAEISIGDRCDNGANLSQDFLICRIDLRIFLDLPLQLFNRLRVSQGIQCSFGSGLLVCKLRLNSIDELFLCPNLLCLLVDVFS
jgi:hypothetical protein